MRAHRFARLKELLIRVRDMPEEEQRAYLDEACKDDPDLRREADSLLAHNEPDEILKTGGARGGSVLDPPLSVGDAETIDPIAAPGQTLGPYILRECIGSGGMGEVWRAEQTTPVRRTVALKLIKAGMDTGQVIARFEAERQALALMDHPVIAKVFDAGTTPQGRPYFAMEYVPGVPITEYCDARKLGTGERLELFQLVCEGVQHAHQKAVIHRDLKPSNILVTDVDGKPQPRIIDFGVAKATTQKLTEKTMYTAMGQLIGTPEYMSPEQADLTAEDVDTRTDVYSLGVILYELLAGALPFEATELRKAGFEGIIKLLREEDPPRPSTKVSSLGERTTEVAQNRRTEPRRLVGQLKGDLDWIVMRSLEKDRNRRYASPQELAQDVQRHLNHEPVLAGPPTPVYRTKKFIRRNRVAVGVTTTIGLAVVLAFVMVTLQNARIAAARDEAELVTATLKEMLASVEPTKTGRDVTVKEMLDETAKTLGEKFKNQPLVEAELRHTVGNTYYELGEWDNACEHLKHAVEIRRDILGDEDPRTLAATEPLVWASMRQSPPQFEEAEALARETLEIRRRVLGEEHPQTLRSMNILALTYEKQGRYGDAAALCRASLEVAGRVLGEEHPQTRAWGRNLGRCLVYLGQLDEAESLAQQALESARRERGVETPYTLQCMVILAGVFMQQGRSEEAETLYREALEIRRRVQGEEHPFTTSNMLNLAGCYESLGRYDEAVVLLQEALEIRQRVFGKEHPMTLECMQTLGYMHRVQGRLEEAEAILRESLAIRRRVLGEQHRGTLGSMFHLARVVLDQGRHDEAEALSRSSLEISRRALGENHETTNAFRYELACALAMLGRGSEAISLLREALDNGYRGPPNWSWILEDPDLASLREAMNNGYRGSPNWSWILDDPELASLHGDSEFEEIVEELKRRNEDGDPATVQ